MVSHCLNVPAIIILFATIIMHYTATMSHYPFVSYSYIPFAYYTNRFASPNRALLFISCQRRKKYIIDIWYTEEKKIYYPRENYSSRKERTANWYREFLINQSPHHVLQPSSIFAFTQANHARPSSVYTRWTLNWRELESLL